MTAREQRSGLRFFHSRERINKRGAPSLFFLPLSGSTLHDAAG